VTFCFKLFTFLKLSSFGKFCEKEASTDKKGREGIPHVPLQTRVWPNHFISLLVRAQAENFFLNCHL